MTVKLALLKSGEEVISDVAEMVVEEKVVGYIFNYPYAAKLFGGLKKGEKNTIQLTPWLPLSKDVSIPVAMDWIITFVEPVTKLSEMYSQALWRIMELKNLKLILLVNNQMLLTD